MKKKIRSSLFKIFNIYDTDNFLNRVIRKSMVIFEKYRIIFKKKFLKIKEVILVYDCKVSPGTIGDYFKMVMVARLMQSLKIKVTF